MAVCVKCGSKRSMLVMAHGADSIYINVDDIEYEGLDGAVPTNINVGEYKYIDINVCVNCGHMVGEWPLHLNVGLTFDTPSSDICHIVEKPEPKATVYTDLPLMKLPGATQIPPLNI